MAPVPDVNSHHLYLLSNGFVVVVSLFVCFLTRKEFMHGGASALNNAIITKSAVREHLNLPSISQDYTRSFLK